MKFHHIGIACFNIDDSADFYLKLGYVKTETVYDPIQNVNISFLNYVNNDMPCIELISPHDNNSPIIKTLNKSGVSPYHICYSTDDIEKDIEKLKKQRFMLISKPAPAVAFEGKRVCFLYNKAIGLMEIVES